MYKKSAGKLRVIEATGKPEGEELLLGEADVLSKNWNGLSVVVVSQKRSYAMIDGFFFSFCEDVK